MKIGKITSEEEAEKALIRAGGVPVAVYVEKQDAEPKLLITAYTEADFKIAVKSAIRQSPVNSCAISRY